MTSYASAGFRWISDTAPKVLSYPIEQRLSLARTRLVVVAGVHDRISPLWWREKLVANLPQAQVITLDHASHGVVPDEYRALTESWSLWPASDGMIRRVHSGLVDWIVGVAWWFRAFLVRE